MPITRVPIVHKFGIISQSQREELQERLMKQAFKQGVSSDNRRTTRNPLDITDDFISQYNSASTHDEKKRVDDIATKMISRSRRRAGIKDGGHGNHVDLPRAWSELSILAQCQGKVQEEALDILITSLDQAPVIRGHIPSLFFLAETTLYWLRTDAMTQPYLRSGEIKLLKMGHLVFTRLFYHHMSGHLHGHSEFKNRLVAYLEGFSDCQEAYSPYPGAHLSLRYISEVGKMIIGDHKADPGEIKEADKIADEQAALLEEEFDFHKRETGFESSIHDLSPTLWHALDVWRCTVHLSTGVKEAVHALSLCGTGLSSENWVDAVSALQVISEAAKVNISVLKTLQSLGKGIVPSDTPRDNVPNQGMSGQHISLSELESQMSHTTFTSSGQDEEMRDSEEEEELRMLEKEKKISQGSDFLMQRHLKSGATNGEGSFTKSSRQASMTALVGTPHDRTDEALSGESVDGRITEQSSKPNTVPDISSREESLDSAGGIPRLPNSDDQMISTEDSDLAPGENSETEESRVDVTKMEMKNLKATPQIKREVTWDDNVTTSSRGPSGVYNLSRSSMRSGAKSPKSVTIDPVPNTAYYAEAGTSLPSGRASEATTLTSYSNAPIPECPGLYGWRWEVAYIYAEIMTFLCLNGKTANIQKLALQGSGKVKALQYKQEKIGPLESAGLLDLVDFHAKTETSDRGHSSWSWRIRYAAVQGLVKICRCCQGDKAREGLRTVAWNALMRCSSKERDDRVLEALKVGQVEADLEAKRQEGLIDSPIENLNAKLAAGLASIYLPPLPPPVESPKPHQYKTRSRKTPSPTVQSPGRVQVRPTLREEIMLSMALYESPVEYNTRTSLDLKRIVEDQWRKELQKKLDEEEKFKEKELEEKREQEEKLQKEIETKREEKLNKRSHSAKSSHKSSHSVKSPSV